MDDNQDLMRYARGRGHNHDTPRKGSPGRTIQRGGCFCSCLYGEAVAGFCTKQIHELSYEADKRRLHEYGDLEIH